MTITRICADILLSGIVRLVILFYLCSKLHIMMGKRTTALQYAFRASLPIMAGYRHGSCWRSSHYAYTLGKVLPASVFALLVVYCLRTVHSLAWGDVAQVIAVVFTILVHVWRRNLMWSIVAGTVCYMALIRVPGL